MSAIRSVLPLVDWANSPRPKQENELRMEQILQVEAQAAWQELPERQLPERPGAARD